MTNKDLFYSESIDRRATDFSLEHQTLAFFLFSYGKTNCCSQRQWRASTLRSRQPCRPLSSISNNMSSKCNKFSRLRSQHRHSKSSCRPNSSSSKVRVHTMSLMAISLKVHLPKSHAASSFSL